MKQKAPVLFSYCTYFRAGIGRRCRFVTSFITWCSDVCVTNCWGTFNVTKSELTAFLLLAPHPSCPSSSVREPLFQPKTGILALVNEDTKHMELATDKTLVRKIIDRHAHSHHFLRYKNDDPRFGIKHFAVPVSSRFLLFLPVFVSHWLTRLGVKHQVTYSLSLFVLV